MLRFSELKELLSRRLHEPLPGADAQVRLAPIPRTGWQPGKTPEDCRPGAGLLLLYPRDDLPWLVLTVRDRDLPHHAGQVALPGGSVDEGETIAQAALREANEEVGLDPDEVEVIGCLSPLHIPLSGFILHPVVAAAGRRPQLTPRPGEVAQILDVPLSDLIDSERWVIETRNFRGQDYEVPFLDLDGERLWGATAMVMAEFLTVAGFPPPPR